MPPGLARVFISYKRIEPDAGVAQALQERLKAAGYDVFIDVDLPVGVRWAEAIEKALRESDILVALLSEQAVASEMTLGEIDTAARLKKRILPVRLAYREPFRYPLSAWLNPINWSYWEGPGDTRRLGEEILRGISGSTLPIGHGPDREALLRPLSPDALVLDSDAIPLESQLYVRRPTDDRTLAAIKGPGRTININGPRRIGKSSLLMRVVAEAAAEGKRWAFFVFGGDVDAQTMGNADAFYFQFCKEIARGLGVQEPDDAEWDKLRSVSGVQRCSRFVQDRVLKSLKEPVVIVLDDVERLFAAPFRKDFFGMLRAWHNKRALPPAPEWKRLSLVLATSIEPHHWVAQVDQSPFNVGDVIELSDFSPREVSQLNQLHGGVLTQVEEAALMTLVGGHPYLVRRALYLVATKAFSAADLLSGEHLDAGPFADHLRSLLKGLIEPGQRPLLEGLREVLRERRCRDVMVLDRLLGSGLVRQEKGSVVPRCELYARYFQEHLLG